MMAGLLRLGKRNRRAARWAVADPLRARYVVRREVFMAQPVVIPWEQLPVLHWEPAPQPSPWWKLWH
jgi:hypothetical protein